MIFVYDNRHNCMVSAQNQAEFKFDQITINVGTFPASSPVKRLYLLYDVGNAPLVINEVIASCGCTIPKYDRRPIAPGQKGSIEITYNGEGKVDRTNLKEHYDKV